MTRQEVELATKDIIERAKENTLNPIVSYMIKAVTDAFEAGLNAGMEVSKLMEEQK